MPMHAVNKDTVEEFWSESVLQECLQEVNSVTINDFVATFARFLGINNPVWIMTSARIALEKFLAVTIPKEKSTVLICSFNCPVVADAVIQAGLSVETYDFADTLGYIDWNQLAKRLQPYHGAIVVPHLFGVPSDFRAIINPAKSQGTLIIEDCAHTLGGYIGEQMAGTIGDAAIFSFNYDKPISLGGGGALLVNNQNLSQELKFAHDATSWQFEYEELLSLLKDLRDCRDRIPRQDKICKITEPSIAGIGNLRAALGIWQLKKYPEIIKKRNFNASFFQKQQQYYHSWSVSPNVKPAWLKQKIVPNGFKKSSLVSGLLQRQGISVGNFNWSQTIDNYLKRPEKPNAALAAKYALEIPIHQNMLVAELDRINTYLTSIG